MAQAPKNVLRQIKIEPELLTLLREEAQDRQITFIDFYSSISDWYINERAQGHFSARTFLPPQTATTRSFWLSADADARLLRQADKDKQPVNRLLYTAIVRYFSAQGLISE